MGQSSLLGTSKAPTEAKGRDTRALGPSDNSDSGSDTVGVADASGTDPFVPVDVALADDAQRQAWGQFVFDRGQLGGEAGLLAVVVSAAGQAVAEGHAALTAGITRQLANDFGDTALATPGWSRVITEKRATFACTPGLQRPDNAGMPAGLALAGDYVAGDYPATLEGAVRSGMAAARRLAA